MSRGRKIIFSLLGIIAVLVLALVIAAISLGQSKPTGAAGAEADELAHKLERASNQQAWAATGAITWTHAARNNHLWDRTRGYDRVRFQDGSEVLLDIARKDGVAKTKDGQTLEGAAAKEEIERAYRWWANDTYWLNPFASLFDQGVTREKVANPEGEPGTTGLLISYSSGGVTPGDSYLWFVPESGPPKAWRMWVSILPVKGIRVDWDGWREVETGAMVSTKHKLAILEFELTDLKAAATLTDLLAGAADPFAALDAKRAAPAPETAPSVAATQPAQ